jgi:hypothetical protein
MNPNNSNKKALRSGVSTHFIKRQSGEVQSSWASAGGDKQLLQMNWKCFRNNKYSAKDENSLN